MSTSGLALEIDLTPARNRRAASRDGSQPAAGEDVGDAKRRLTLERNSACGSQEASVSRNASWMTMSTPSLTAVGRNVSTIFGSGPAARTVAVASHGDETSSAAWRWPSAVSPHVVGGVAASTADRQCRTRTTRTPAEYGVEQLVEAPPPMLHDRLPFDVVPAVRAHIESGGLHDEVRLVGTPTPTIELEVELATQHDRARVVDHVSGFLVHLSHRCLLERLGRIESTSGKEADPFKRQAERRAGGTVSPIAGTTSVLAAGGGHADALVT